MSDDADPPPPCGFTLPLAGWRRERGDAAANRERILAAARRLVLEHGTAALSMDAVAAAAGVGKGTVFRRFGDRAGLTQALFDDAMRTLQDAFLSGPPPLGPGAPPAERLEAFVLELIRSQGANLTLALIAEAGAGQGPSLAHGALTAHLRSLLRALDPALDDAVLSTLILGAIAPPVQYHLRERLGADTARLEAAALALLRGAATGRGR